MLSVAKLATGQEAYYERSVARGLDDYYAGAGESPGVWTGRGAESLGLVGVVGEGDLSRLISGLDPATGQRLRSHARPRMITIERIDPTTGERGFEQRELRPVAGFDLVFSVPQSVSLLHALGDHETRRLVSDAHDSAWRAALDYLESEACVARRGAAGIVREHAGGFVAAAFQHRTSRALDPHLHTHVVVANLAQSPDGTWRALEGDAILRGYRLAAGHLYQAQLRAGLSRSLGVEWAEPSKGLAELAGMPAGIVEAFSTRRQQIVQRLEETGGTTFAVRAIAAPCLGASRSTRTRLATATRVVLRRCSCRRCRRAVHADGGTVPYAAGDPATGTRSDPAGGRSRRSSLRWGRHERCVRFRSLPRQPSLASSL